MLATKAPGVNETMLYQREKQSSKYAVLLFLKFRGGL